jgi:1-deoxyxylulose-5-phosphate synthase
MPEPGNGSAALSADRVTGRLLAKMFKRRDDYVLATKVFYPMGPGPNDRGLSRKHIVSAIDASLRRLGTDYVDLYQIHRFDVHTPVEETVQALDDLIRSGKVRYVGAGLIPYSPPARGLLAGTRQRSGITGTKRAAVSGGDRLEDFAVQDAVRDIAAQRLLARRALPGHGDLRCARLQ